MILIILHFIVVNIVQKRRKKVACLTEMVEEANG